MKLPEFDYRNCLQEAVGNDGIAPSALHERATADVVAAFRRRVDSGEIGFPNLPDDHTTLRAIEQFCGALRKKIDDVLLVGIGGSALGAYALDVAIRGPHPIQTVGKKAARPRLIVLDNVDPGPVASALSQLDPKRTAVVVIAKSGGTAETMGTFLIVREWMVKKLGRKSRERIIAITDPQKGDLLAIAKEEKYPLFFVPPNVGGRFSVFCPVGLVPAALIGLDTGKLLHGAGEANNVCWGDTPNGNPALTAALVHHALAKRGKNIEVAFAYSSYLWGAAFWYRQLWAESLGKRVNRQGQVVEAGQTPIAALGVTDQHSQLQLYMEGPRDKMFTLWSVRKHRVDVKMPKSFRKIDSTGYLGGQSLGKLLEAERTATESALTSAGRPNCRWTLPQVDESTLGAFFQMLEFQTAFAGELWGVNAFDQPGVELGKKLTYALMGRKGYSKDPLKAAAR
jgi:glucose-6-phosphate isomerase